METDIGIGSLQEVDAPFIEGEADNEPPHVRRYDRERHVPERYGFNISEGNDAHVDSNEPISYQEAMAGPEATK